MIFPAAIIFVNADLTANVQAMIVRQLAINEVIDGYTWDNRVAADSNYPTEVRNNQLRLMVVRDLTGPDNRNRVDLVMFVKAGMVTVIQNNLTGNSLTSTSCNKNIQPQISPSVKTQHHLYKDQKEGFQFEGYKFHRHEEEDEDDDIHTHGHAPTFRIVNLSWGTLGVM